MRASPLAMQMSIAPIISPSHFGGGGDPQGSSVVVICAIFKNYGTASYRENFLVGEFTAAEPAGLSFSFNFFDKIETFFSGISF
jgi:hypothetical protein